MNAVIEYDASAAILIDGHVRGPSQKNVGKDINDFGTGARLQKPHIDRLTIEYLRPVGARRVKLSHFYGLSRTDADYMGSTNRASATETLSQTTYLMHHDLTCEYVVARPFATLLALVLRSLLAAHRSSGGRRCGESLLPSIQRSLQVCEVRPLANRSPEDVRLEKLEKHASEMLSAEPVGSRLRAVLGLLRS